MAPRDIEEWQLATELAEADLRERVDRAMLGEPTEVELAAFAAERDALALDRDALADARDLAAADRDRDALGRDVSGSRRDRAARDVTQDRDAGATARFVAGGDRESSAGDRSDSREDRRRSADARRKAAGDRQRAADDRAEAAMRHATDQGELVGLRQALETRLTIGRAEGLLMAKYGVTGDGAFQLLTRLSQEGHLKLREVAARIVALAETDASDVVRR